MFLRLMAVGGMSAVLGLGAMSPRYVVDNVEETLTFSAEELNNNTYNYTFEQLIAYYDENGHIPDTVYDATISYNNSTYTLEDVIHTEDYTYIFYLTEDNTGVNIQFGNSENNQNATWKLIDNNIDRQYTFEYEMTINDAIWWIEYIEDPVQPSTLADVLGQFIEVLVGGISQLAEGIATGVVSMAGALFLEYDNGVLVGLSTFGGIIAIFSGLALSVSLTTKVYAWVTSLGN